jgi:hypothetical protein
MIARFAGECLACGEDICPGDSIRKTAGGYRHADCGSVMDEDEAAGFAPGTLANDRRLARQGLTVIRMGSRVETRNRRGRCEDAPCCGCCS